MTSPAGSDSPGGGTNEEDGMSPSSEESSIVVSGATEQEVMEVINNQSTWDRLSYLVKLDENSLRYHEANLIRSSFSFGALGMGLFTFMTSYKGFIERFNRANKHTTFATHFLASRHRYDATLQMSIKKSCAWAIRGGLFTGTVMTVSQIIPLLRNKSGIIEYTAGGVVAGGLSRGMLGPRGVAAGAVLGGLLGTVAGLAIYPAQVYRGETQEDLHYQRVKAVLDNERFCAYIQEQGSPQATGSPVEQPG